MLKALASLRLFTINRNGVHDHWNRHQAAIAGQHRGIDAIGLGQLPQSFGEAPGAVGPYQHGFAADSGHG